MKFLMIITLLFAATPQHVTSYAIYGATVESELACRSSSLDDVARWHLTATQDGAGRYVVPGLSTYPTISLLTTQPGQATRDGDSVSWHQHATGEELVIFAGGRNACAEDLPLVVSVGRVWLPLVLR